MARDSLAITIEALSWMAYEGVGERTALFRAAKQLGVESPIELRHAHRLIMETSRYRNRLDILVKKSIGSRGVEQMPHGVISFLRTLAYLKYVDGAKQRDLLQIIRWAREVLGWRDLHPFETAIALLASGTLDAYARNLSEFERVALEMCHPAWFVEKTFRTFGRDFALNMLRRNLRQMPTYIRMNPLATSDLRNDAQSKPGQATQVPGLAEVWIINKPFRGPQTEATRSGRLVIQDFASIVAGLVAEVRPDQVVLDLCAAPGNKTSHLAALMNNRGRIYSVDISDRRLERWKEEMGRTGVEIADCVRANAAMLPLEVEADVVLVDPPCSNTGVFARNPSAKWSVTQKRLTDQVARQRAILRDSANHVKPGGTLVYCTCSILPEENEFVVEDFLRVSGEFQLAKQTPFIGSPGLRGLERCQRFYPHIHECNGYFIARFRRAI